MNLEDIKARLETSAYASVEEATVDLQALVDVVDRVALLVDKWQKVVNSNTVSEWAVKTYCANELSDALYIGTTKRSQL